MIERQVSPEGTIARRITNTPAGRRIQRIEIGQVFRRIAKERIEFPAVYRLRASPPRDPLFLQVRRRQVLKILHRSGIGGRGHVRVFEDLVMNLAANAAASRKAERSEERLGDGCPARHTGRGDRVRQHGRSSMRCGEFCRPRSIRSIRRPHSSIQHGGVADHLQQNRGRHAGNATADDGDPSTLVPLHPRPVPRLARQPPRQRLLETRPSS